MGRVGGGATFRVFTSERLPAVPAEAPVGDFVVGVVDTGVVLLEEDRPHRFLDGRLADGWQDNVDGLSEPETPQDGHGTFVCGVILQQAPGVTIDIRGALDPAGDNDAAVADALRSLGAIEHVKLINLSFFGDETTAPIGIRRALADVFHERPDLLVVTAAGNGWTDERAWPAAFSLDFEQVLAIGAVDEWVVPVPGRVPPPASFSNDGLYVDAWAGGVNVLGPIVGPGRTSAVCRWSGTSFAAAAVTGRIAQTMLEEKVDAKMAWARLTDSAQVIPVPGTAQWLWRPYITTGGPEWITV